jgi:hypothetical protein
MRHELNRHAVRLQESWLAGAVWFLTGICRLKQCHEKVLLAHRAINFCRIGSSHCLNVRTCSKREADTKVVQLAKRSIVVAKGGCVSPKINYNQPFAQELEEIRI